MTAAPTMISTVELLWFSDCPNHEGARRMPEEVVNEIAPGTPIRVDGRDIDPTYLDLRDRTKLEDFRR